MAQANSAQREPSMEEILASIRRIIEDSDTMRQPFEEAERAQFPLDAEIAGVQQQVEEFRVELNAPQAVNADAAVEADVFIPPAMPKPVTNIAEHLPEVTASPLPQAKDEITPYDVAQPDEIAAPAINDAQPETSLHQSMIKDDGVEPDTAADSMSVDNRPSLISDQAGRQVAASFGELSEAFAASRRRSFDDMAEEMLRPMLQDWLDNNLPTLVERLVREEIERVARGG